MHFQEESGEVGIHKRCSYFEGLSTGEDNCSIINKIYVTDFEFFSILKVFWFMGDELGF